MKSSDVSQVVIDQMRLVSMYQLAIGELKALLAEKEATLKGHVEELNKLLPPEEQYVED